MRRAAVLGSGYMGGAITFPLADRGFDVRLWGTWLDDEIIERCGAGEAHPRIGLPLRKSVRCLPSGRLAEAVDGADVVFIAVASEGFAPVLERLLLETAGELPVLVCLTKGLIETESRVTRISEYARASCSEAGTRMAEWVSVGGPVKAVELAHGVPTATAMAGTGSSIRDLRRDLSTSYYRVMLYGDDVTGLEMCSALKNVYAIAIGIVNGLHAGRDEVLHDNHRAYLFSWALREMAEIVEDAGGLRHTVSGFPGCGDLFVTQASGRNGRLGRLIGTGVPPDEAYGSMLDEDEIAEGYQALRLSRVYLEERSFDIRRVPLLGALNDIVFRGGEVREVMRRFVSVSGADGVNGMT